MKLRYTRAVALGASAVLAAGAVSLVGASSASAATLTTYLGPISTSGTSGPGSSGTVTDNFSFTTAAGCPATDGAGTNTKNFRAIINGPSWSNVTVVGNTTAGVNAAGPQAFPIADNFTGLALVNGLPLPSGSYRLTGFCQSATGAATSGRFYAEMVFTGSAFTIAPLEEATSTTLTAPAAGTVAVGSTTTATAQVTKSGTEAALAGTVQFKVNGTDLGAPVAINGSGQAPSPTITVVSGANSITAVFVPDNTANATQPPTKQVVGSTSTAVVVTGATATPTTTGIIAPAAGFAGNPVTLNAQVPPADTVNGANVSGSVAFFVTPSGGAESAIASCASVTVVTNGASCTIAGVNVTAGTFTYRAAFTPTSNHGASSSGQSAPPTVIASLAPTRVATEFIRTTVPPGALTITVQGYVAASPQTPKTGDNANAFAAGGTVNSTVPYAQSGAGAGVTSNLDANGNDVTTGNSSGVAAGGATSAQSTNVVVLPQTVLNPAGTLLVSNGYIIPVVTTDTRAGDLPFNVTGKLLGDFEGLNPANQIDGRNLGWDPIFIKSSRFPGQTTVDGVANGAEVTWTDTNGRDVKVKNGSLIAPSNGILVGQSLPAGWSEGLRPTVADADTQAGNVAYPTGTRTLFSVDHGAGTWWWGAKLSLQAPTTTQPDTYQATLQMTANGTGA